MFDRYYVSQNFTCPNCGTIQDCTKTEFQTQDLEGSRTSCKLGDIIDSSLAKIKFLTACSESQDRLDTSNPKKPKIIKGKCLGCFWCYVYLDKDKRAYRERVTALDYSTGMEILVYEKTIAEK